MIKTVSQTEFNRDFKKFEKTLEKERLVVYKNNKPSFVAIPFEEFVQMVDEDEAIFKLAIKRLIEIKNGKRKTLKGKDAWKAL